MVYFGQVWPGVRVPLPIERVDGLAEESDGSRCGASELDAAVRSDRTLITVMEASAGGVSQQRFPSFMLVLSRPKIRLGM
ncbi:MAG: hypothetical protein ACRDOU_02645 [Streptosporangiaceae bacterium]